MPDRRIPEWHRLVALIILVGHHILRNIVLPGLLLAVVVNRLLATVTLQYAFQRLKSLALDQPSLPVSFEVSFTIVHNLLLRSRGVIQALHEILIVLQMR